MKDNLTFKKSRKALLKLLEKKDYDEISVADIVKECGFSRQNFYKNFSNKDELFKSIFMYDIKKALDREILYEFGKTSINIIDIISENKNLYLSVLYSSSGDFAYRLFFEYVCIMFRSFAEYSAYRNLSQAQERALHFYVSGLIVMIYRFLSGEEKILVADINQGKKITEYDKDNDFSLYSVDSNPTVLTLSAGDFAVFYPQDLHKPCLALNEPAKVQKIVVKVKI